MTTWLNVYFACISNLASPAQQYVKINLWIKESNVNISVSQLCAKKAELGNDQEMAQSER